LALVVRDAPTGEDLSDTQIKAHLKAFADAGVISKFGIPDKILFVETLPKTSVGKFNKRKLREQYGGR
jgi:fatty-acyl-CoA synthase